MIYPFQDIGLVIYKIIWVVLIGEDNSYFSLLKVCTGHTREYIQQANANIITPIRCPINDLVKKYTYIHIYFNFNIS